MTYIMVFGGSLNKDGSDYVRKVMEAEKIVIFLERLKKDLKPNEKTIIENTIEVIENYILELSEKAERTKD